MERRSVISGKREGIYIEKKLFLVTVLCLLDVLAQFTRKTLLAIAVPRVTIIYSIANPVTFQNNSMRIVHCIQNILLKKNVNFRPALK